MSKEWDVNEKTHTIVFERSGGGVIDGFGFSSELKYIIAVRASSEKEAISRAEKYFIGYMNELVKKEPDYGASHYITRDYGVDVRFFVNEANANDARRNVEKLLSALAKECFITKVEER